jgi:NADP-dependent 3-hydroxy acid dehydrogenase YdfG
MIAHPVSSSLTVLVLALVTGGGSVIGLMIVQALAMNGVKVYVTGRPEEKLEKVAEL